VVRRRDAIAGLAALTVPSAIVRSGAAQGPKVLRVGVATMLKPTEKIYTGLIARMAELGYDEGRNFVFDFVSAASPAEYPARYAEIVARGANILFAGGSEPVLRAARQAADGKVPVVFLAIDYDPFRTGYVASLARPGKNITGIFVRQVELAQKRVEIAREALPGVRRLGLWWDDASREQFEASAAAAKVQGFETSPIEVNGQARDYPAAFGAGDAVRAEAIVLPTSPTFFRTRVEIGLLAVEHRMPLITAVREYVDAGALLSYGVDVGGAFRDTATYFDRIARGATPADLPVEQPTKFELVINLKTAKALGLTIPPSILARADEVIE
jgi:putative tryptophan/tyrosine transport system substrate-binding protein